MPAEDAARQEDRFKRSKILEQCVVDTTDYISRKSLGDSIRTLKNSGILIANCYFLISDAYKLRRGMQDSRTHKYKVAAFTVAAIMAVRPIRIADTSSVVSIAAAQANQQCGMRAAQALLGLDLETLDRDFLRRMYASVFDIVELPCLAPYIADFEKNFPQPSAATFEQVEKAMPFAGYENIEFSELELKTIEILINQFTTLEKSNGHPFLRLLLGWGWRWS
ncbi:MAG: hypothetical protein QOD11_3260 [Bradyrhizobium sp.]|jgi:hypothetical protein|nr:hypothetical protein [Bradyrhizobium sp.]